MKRLRTLTFTLVLLGWFNAIPASSALLGQTVVASATQMAAVKAADDLRVAAMKAPSKEKLDEVFSNELRYAHSTGTIDTKESFIEILTSGKSKYLGYDYEEREFTFPAPGIALMTGRAHIRTESANGKMDNVLSFLAVWREENGKWKFLAWQSCRLPPKP